MNELVFREKEGQPLTNSLLVADKFGKEHKNVIQAIENIFVSAENSAETYFQEVKSMFVLSDYEYCLNNGTGAVGSSLILLGVNNLTPFQISNLLIMG